MGSRTRCCGCGRAGAVAPAIAASEVLVQSESHLGAKCGVPTMSQTARGETGLTRSVRRLHPHPTPPRRTPNAGQWAPSSPGPDPEPATAWSGPRPTDTIGRDRRRSPSGRPGTVASGCRLIGLPECADLARRRLGSRSLPEKIVAYAVVVDDAAQTPGPPWCGRARRPPASAPRRSTSRSMAGVRVRVDMLRRLGW